MKPSPQWQVPYDISQTLSGGDKARFSQPRQLPLYLTCFLTQDTVDASGFNSILGGNPRKKHFMTFHEFVLNFGNTLKIAQNVAVMSHWCPLAARTVRCYLQRQPKVAVLPVTKNMGFWGSKFWDMARCWCHSVGTWCIGSGPKGLKLHCHHSSH